MAQSKEKKEPERPCVCVCGRPPCVTKHKSRYIVSCTAPIHCAMRTGWASTEQQAINNWNTIIKTTRQERSG